MSDIDDDRLAEEGHEWQSLQEIQEQERKDSAAAYNRLVERVNTDCAA